MYTGTSTNVAVDIELNGQTLASPLANKVDYLTGKTAKVTGISPLSGSSYGNYDVTITGTGFGTDKNVVSVKIDTVVCVVKTVIDTQIVCTAGVRSTYVKDSLEILVNGFKAAN